MSPLPSILRKVGGISSIFEFIQANHNNKMDIPVYQSHFLFLFSNQTLKKKKKTNRKKKNKKQNQSIKTIFYKLVIDLLSILSS